MINTIGSKLVSFLAASPEGQSKLVLIVCAATLY